MLKIYVYKTTNLITGKQYIGERMTHKNPEKDLYLGSGKLLKIKIKQYKRKNFKKEILEYFDTKEQAFDAQEKYIKEYNTLVPNGYNISPKGGHGVKDCMSEETKQKIGQSNKGKKLSLESKQQISQSLLGNIPWNKNKKTSEETKQKIGQSNKGKQRTQQFKEGVKQFHTGRKRLKETGEKIRLKKIGVLRSSETIEKIRLKKLGVQLSEEHKNKIRKSEIGKIVSQETKLKTSNSIKEWWKNRKINNDKE